MSWLAKGALGLLSLMVAVSVYAFTEDSLVRFVVGGDTGTIDLADCKKPCKDTDKDGNALTFILYECLDPCAFKKFAICNEADKIGNGGACNKRFCTVNTYRIYTCEAGTPASGNECKWKDCAGWRRQHQIYEQACTTTTPAKGPDYKVDWTALCKREGQYSSITTPCVTTATICDATGTLKDTGTYTGRRCCN